MTSDPPDLTAVAGAKVLVTGGGGFLGRVLSRQLARLGCQVRLMVRREEQAGNTEAGIQAAAGDVADAGAVERAVAGATVVFHLAAANRGTRAEFERTNVEGTRNVVQACLRQPACRLVHVSSLGVLDHAGRDPSAGPLREDARIEPCPSRRGYYTQTKLAAETIVRRAMQEQGLRAVILRPGQIFGPGAERITPNGVIALRGWNLVGDGRLPLPLVYVDDVVDALVLAGFREGVEGDTFHIVDPASVTQNEYLAAWKGRVQNLPLRRIPRPVVLAAAAVIEFAARLAGREPLLSRYRVRSLRPLSGFDTDFARRKLGWSPRVGARSGLARTFGAVPGSVPS